MFAKGYPQSRHTASFAVIVTDLLFTELHNYLHYLPLVDRFIRWRHGIIKVFYRCQTNLDEATDHWGIKVERVEIKDVKLPHQLQRAMAAEAEATREARAKVGT